MAAALLASACSNNYAWVRKDNVEWARQYMNAQQAERQELLAQQRQFADVLDRLNTTLEQSQQLAPAVERLNQALARPLKLDTGSLAQAIRPAMAAPKDKPGEAATVDGKKMLVGSVETAWFPQLKKRIESRIDTGAQSSSLNVAAYEIIERDGVKWVRFSIENPADAEKKDSKGEEKKEASADGADSDSDGNEDNDMPVFELKLVRHVKILQSSTDEKDRRPVVKLQVMIGNVAQEAEFTLADRDHLSYDALIGRNALRDLMIVDVSQDHVTRLPKDLDK